MGDPVITFAIPYYKGLHYLKKCVESVQKQSDPRWKIVISCDLNCDPIPEKFFPSHVEIHRASQSLGLVGNFNRCLELSSTPLTCILHSDDEVLPNYTSEMHRLWKQHPTAKAYTCQVDVINEQSQKFFSLQDAIKKVLHPRSTKDEIISGDLGLAQILKGNFIFCPALCFNTKQAFSEQWSQVTDLDWMARYLHSGNSIAITSQTCFHYRRHLNSMTSLNTNLGKRYQEELDFYRSIKDKFSDTLWAETLKQAHLRTILRAHILYSSIVSLCSLNLNQAWIKFKILFHDLFSQKSS